MSAPLVSVVVPVYDVEAYLPQCLDSLIGQTLEEIEIICVNDASTDGSAAILREYAAREARIRVIDRPVNEGLSVARNVGIGAARGAWLAFVDSDDLVDPELCRKALERARFSGADLVIYDYAEFWLVEDLDRARSEPSRLTGIDPADTAALLSLSSYAWTKFVRTDHLRTLGAGFPPGLTYEDLPFHWELLIKTRRVALLPERLCYYRQRAGSIGYRTDLSRADRMLVHDLVHERLAAESAFQAHRAVFIRDRLRSFFIVFDTIDPRHRPRVLELISERMDPDHWEAVNDDPLLDRRTRDFLLSLQGSMIAKARRAAWLATRWCYRAVRGRLP